MQIKLEDIARNTGGHLMHPLSREMAELLVTGACVDSRLVRPGDLFFCLKGRQVDGHVFARQAVEAGAVAVVAEQDPFVNEVNAKYLMTPVILSSHPERLLGRLANYWRKMFKGTVIGITGSAGKTTTKEILAGILALDGPTAKNYLNRNTQVGMPLAMLAASGQEKYWVIEVGINRDHDMEDLAPILQPDLALITNVGSVHMQGLGLQGVARHKTNLLRHLSAPGQAIVSADYPDLVNQAKEIVPELEFFSVQDQNAKFYGQYLGLGPDERGLFSLRLDQVRLEPSCYLTGPHGAEDLIAAASTAYLLGVDPQLIKQGIEQATPPEQRFVRRQIGNWQIIDDSYNANPLSYPRVLDALAELGRDKQLILVLGDMLELGEQAEAEHAQLAGNIIKSGALAVFWRGEFGWAVEHSLEQAGWEGHFSFLSGNDDLLPRLEAYLSLNQTEQSRMIMFKGSRGLTMENIVATFMNWAEKDAV